MKKGRKVSSELDLRKSNADNEPPSLPSNGNHASSIYEHVPIGIVESSPTGKYINVNEEFCHIVGYEKQELLQLGIKDLTDEEDYPIDIKLHEQLILGQIPFYRLEKRYVHKDGGRVWAELTRSVVRNAAGTPLYTVGVVLDISDRKHVERVLRESVERLRLATEAARMFTWELDFKTQLYTFSDNFEKVLGFSAGLLPVNTVENVQKLSPAEDVQVILTAFTNAVARQDDLHALQYRIINPENGQVVWLEANAKIIYDPHGTPERMFGVAQNITENKKTQEQILIISKMPEENPNPVLRLSRAGQLLYANQPGTSLISSWKGTSDRVIPDSLHQSVQEAFATGAKKEVEIEHEGKTLTGTLAPVLEAGYVNFYGNDITERKRAEERLRLATEAARLCAWDLDIQNQTYTLGENFAQVLGFSADLLPATSAEILQLSPTEDIQMIRETVAQAIRSHQDLLRLQYRLLNPQDGQVIWLEVNAKLVYDTQGKPQHMFGMAQNITEKRRQEEEVRRLNRELTSQLREMSALLDILPTGVWIGNEDCSIITGNPAAYQIMGLTPGINASITNPAPELPSALRVFVDDVEVTPEDAPMQQVARTAKPLYNLQHELLFPDGTRKSVYANIVPVLDQTGHVQKVIGAYTDFSEYKRAERELAFLSALGEHIRSAGDPEELIQLVCGMTAQYFGVSHCAFSQIDLADDIFTVRHEYRIADVPSLVGAYRLSNYPREQIDLLSKGQAVLVEDAATDPLTRANYETAHRPFGYRAYLVQPVLRNKVWVGALFINDTHPRQWLENEVNLLGTIAERTWLTMEKLGSEKALRESEERFRAIFNQATAGILREDADARLLFVNQAFCTMLGYPTSELIGKTIWEFTHQEDVEENKKLFDRLVEEGIPFQLEKRFVRADGSLLWVDSSVSPILDASGRPQSAVLVVVDITERKNAEAALQQLNLQLEHLVEQRTFKLNEAIATLREEIVERRRVEQALRESEATARLNEEKLRTLFDLLPVGISFLSPEGQILQMNSALANILRMSKEDIFSQAYTSRNYIRTDGSRMPASEFASMRALREGKTVYNVETGMILENGEVVWMSVSAAPVAVAEVGAAAVTVDITKNKRVERALQESHERLRILSQRLVEVQEEERRAIARELHDRVGQSLSALSINMSIMKTLLPADSLPSIGARFDDSVQLLSEIISLVRDVMSNLRPAVLDDYGLEVALDEYAEQYSARYGIRVRREKPRSPIPRLEAGIEMTFLRIAQEALMNVARHAQAQEVRLALFTERNMLTMTIEDNGLGVQSWQQANRPGSHGLTIMRERAEAFGGTFRVSSVPGKGTKIEVSIPIQPRRKNEALMEAS